MSSVHSRPFVLWIGVLVPSKSPLEVIDIARALPALDFVMIGFPSDASILDRLMRGKTPNLHYLGPVSDRLKNDLIRRSSAGITTSRYEGFGWTPFEFLTEGKPVVAYPLGVFREIYGDLIIYADDTSAFIRHLTELHRKAFKVRIDSRELARLRRWWSLAPAAWRIAKLLDLKSLTIFARDYPLNSNKTLGADVINWKLWRSLSDTGIRLHIFANGTRYSTRFRLSYRTTVVGQPLIFVKAVRSALTNAEIGRTAMKRIDTVVAKVLDLGLKLLEPACYAFGYMKSKDRNSQYIAASDIPTILAGLVVKLILGPRLVCIIHDARFYDIDLPRSSFPMKVYIRTFTYCLRFVDRIIVVSKATWEALSRFCPDGTRFILLWERDNSLESSRTQKSESCEPQRS